MRRLDHQAQTRIARDNPPPDRAVSKREEIALVVIPQEYRNELCEGFNHLRDLARNKGNAEPR